MLKLINRTRKFSLIDRSETLVNGRTIKKMFIVFLLRIDKEIMFNRDSDPSYLIYLADSYLLDTALPENTLQFKMSKQKIYQP